jgi:hypothetical protein
VTAPATNVEPPFATTDEVRALVDAFERGTLPRARWTHGAHVAVALWYLVWYGPGDATDRVRAAIQRYNAAHGVVQTPTGGYHETLTRFYMWAVRRHLTRAPLEGSLADLANGAVAALADRTLPLDYWSRDRLLSWEARTRWVEPDLRPLD